MTITENGNVIVGSGGTTTYNAALQVAGDITTTVDGNAYQLYYTESRDFIKNSGASAYIRQIDNDTTNAFIDFQAWDNSSIMRVMNSGNVGIGDTNPGAKLRVVGLASSVNLGGGSVNSAALYVNATSGHAGELVQIIDKNNAEKFHISNAGNVGIGETVPQTKLHVKTGDSGGTVYNTGYNPLVIEGSSHTGLQILSPNTHNGMIYFGDNNSAVSGRIEYEHANDDMIFVTAGTERMCISSGGIVTKPYQPAFSAYANTNETTVAGATAPFTATMFDQGGNYSTANRRFVAPVAGIYQFSTYTNANGVSAGGAMWCAFAVNGAYRGAYMYQIAPTSSWNLIGGTQTMSLAANDYVEVKAGVNMHWDYGNAAWSNFSGHLVG
jgi:hypothetical protein